MSTHGASAAAVTLNGDLCAGGAAADSPLAAAAAAGAAGAVGARLPLRTPMGDTAGAWAAAAAATRPPPGTPGAAAAHGSMLARQKQLPRRLDDVEMAEWPTPQAGVGHPAAAAESARESSAMQSSCSQSPQSPVSTLSGHIAKQRAEMSSALSVTGTATTASPRAAVTSSPTAPMPSKDDAVMCIINGLFTIRLPIEGSIDVPVPSSLRINGDGASLYAQCVACFTTASAVDRIGPRQQVRVSMVFRAAGHAAGNLRREIFVGYLSGGGAMHCSATHFIPFLPATATVSSVVVDSVSETDADEERFCVDVRRIFHSNTVNPMGGSLPSAVAQHHAKILPLYNAVIMQRYQGSWHYFLRAHPKDFSLYQLSHADIDQEQLAPWVKPNEMRVALTGIDARRADAQRAAAYRSHEARFTKFLESILTGVPGLDQRQVMEHLVDNPDFLHFATPSYSTLTRFLLQHRPKFVWSSHPNLIATIGLGRGQRVADAPRLRGGRGVTTLSLQQQKQQQECQTAHRSKYRSWRNRRAGARGAEEPPKLMSWNGDVFNQDHVHEQGDEHHPHQQYGEHHPHQQDAERPGSQGAVDGISDMDRWGGMYPDAHHDPEQYTMQ